MVVTGAAPGNIPDICGSCLNGLTPLGAVAGKGRASLRGGLGLVGKAIREKRFENFRQCRDFAVADAVIRESRKKRARRSEMKSKMDRKCTSRGGG